MKATIVKILKVLLPIVLGVGLFWVYYTYQLDEESKTSLIDSFKKAEYSWVVISMVIAVISHVFRAARWNLLIETTGYKTSLWHTFLALMLGYFANLILPRAGEATRCAVLSKQTKVPFATLLGSVIGERAFDMIILMLVVAVTFFIQLELLSNLFQEYFLADLNPTKWIIMGVIGVVAIVAAVVVFKILKAKGKFDKLVELWEKFNAGIKSILKVRQPLMFVVHTIGIWTCYFIMFGICFESLSQTTSVPIPGMLSAFVMGSFGILVVPGGIGVYPLLVGAALEVYNVEEGIGQALGWIIWGSQTLMILIVGGLSFLGVSMTQPMEGNEIVSDES